MSSIRNRLAAFFDEPLDALSGCNGNNSVPTPPQDPKEGPSDRPQDINTPLFRDVWGKVTLHAIRKVKSVYDEIRNLERQGLQMPDCSGTFYVSTGFPCKHLVKSRLDANESLQPNDFHSPMAI
ncbi:hypothetical protein I7I53_00682 [Histoplasma capsulatum var. duboisii H88]|uniref:Uncharacterized protein n=2 Tax=Ajellomyces capsulatus TaxID=5037 RepID=A0A8A1LKB1_AJEC8|nr:predicted protein [Histoplasma capsulatum H143]QSS53425.1 hypothetical protein I7I53_00682 [Histoplasma capsulatum var. duboisii H88]